MRCEKCGIEIKNDGTIFGPDCAICSYCLDKMQKAPVRCPVCGNATEPEEALGLLLTRADATVNERINASTALVHVCPQCHVMFFDDFQYDILRMLKQS